MADVWRQQLTVAFDYTVSFTESAFRRDNDAVRLLVGDGPRVLVVIDDGVAQAWPQLAADVVRYFGGAGASDEGGDTKRGAPELVAEPYVVAGGEASKNDPTHVEWLWGRLDHHGIDRHSYVVAIGGGAFLDWVGYAAATVHRGVRLVRVPTTVLSQADSGVGVKNGINAFGKKNMIGTFAPPHGVVIDTSFLSTLSRRDAIAGMAEAVKVALIRDADFFEWLVRHSAQLASRDMVATRELVRRCAELHVRHIATSGDPFEMGSARPLDFGHWAAHKLETLSNHQLRHGEAVAIGIALDTLYSVEMGMCPAPVADAVLSLFKSLGFSLWHAAVDQRQGERRCLLGGLQEFREHLGGELTITLLEGIGAGVEVHSMDEPAIERAFARLESFAAAAFQHQMGP